ncbi:MAG: thermosome subunit beta [Candidatus Methanomethylicia archaeon]
MSARIASMPVLVLKEGTSRSIGREAQENNISAAIALANIVRSSLGPKSMDKMLVDSFGDVTITNDGATILKEMDVQHPAAKMLVEVAKAQDQEVGDGTATATVLAGELLKSARELLDSDVHPTVIVDGYRRALDKALEILDSIAEPVDPMDRKTLMDIALTCLSGKVVTAGAYEKLAELAVEAVLQVAEKINGKWKVDIDNIKVEKKHGKSIDESVLVSGIVLDKEVVHEGMPKLVKNAKIALLECPIEIEKPEISAKINITRPDQMKRFLEEETQVLKKMIDKIASVGANVVICEKGIDDVAQHFLAKKGIMAVRRAKRSDMEKLAKATGGRIVSSIEDISEKDLGEAGLVEERRVAEDKMVFVEQCKNPKAVTILLRGGSDQLVAEAERSIHDAICVVRDVVQEPKIVGGGGAVEIEVAKALREYAKKLSGKDQLAVMKYADALEVIPLALAENAGLDPIDIIVKLKAAHEKMKWAGINTITGDISDMLSLHIVDPVNVKKQALKSATEAAIMILRIDDIIAAARPEKEKEKKPTEGAPSEFE